MPGHEMNVTSEQCRTRGIASASQLGEWMQALLLPTQWAGFRYGLGVLHAALSFKKLIRYRKLMRNDKQQRST
jgi:hypothetical protein